MKPSEKAKELYYKFTYVAPLDSDNKECALIAVNEIIDTLYYHRLGSEVYYWQEVKQEILKL